MTARRYTLRLHQTGRWRAEQNLNLDPADDGRLRAVLESWVEKRAGTLQLDLSEWSMRVHTLGGGRVVATVTIQPNGATAVKRG
jgi:hypothetical protein